VVPAVWQQRLDCNPHQFVCSCVLALPPCGVALLLVRHLLWTAVALPPSAQDKASWQGQTSTLVDGSSQFEWGRCSPQTRAVSQKTEQMLLVCPRKPTLARRTDGNGNRLSTLARSAASIYAFGDHFPYQEIAESS